MCTKCHICHDHGCVDVPRRRLQEEEGIRKAQLEIAAEGEEDSDGMKEEKVKSKPEKKVKKERKKTADTKEETVTSLVDSFYVAAKQYFCFA